MTDIAVHWLNDGQIILIAGFAVLLVTIGAIVLSVIAMRPRLRLQRRMAEMGIVETSAGGRPVRSRDPEQRRIQERLRELEAKGKQRRRKFQLRAMMSQAGLDIGGTAYFALSALTGVSVAVILVALGYSILVALLFGAIGGLLLPRLILGIMARRRQARFTREFPNAIDILVRGIRSGLPVTECLDIIGREMPDPVGMEFRTLVEGQKMGVTLEQMLIRALDRMPTAEFKFFAIVIQVQQQIGGSLADTLSNLSHVLRERKKMRDKATAMSSEAKASAAIIAAIPFGVATIVSFVSPDYLDPFFNTFIGKFLFYGCLVWMVVGVLVMRRMINIRI